MSTSKITQLVITAVIALAFVLSAGPAEARRSKKDRSKRVRVVHTKPKKIRSNGRQPKTRIIKSKRTRTIRKNTGRTRGVRKVVVKKRSPRRTVIVKKRRPAPKVSHVYHRRPRRTVVVHKRRAPRRVVHVHHRTPPRKVVHVHHDTPEAVSVETTERVETYREPEVDAYLGANLQSFTPSVAPGLLSDPDNLGLNVHAGLRFDDRVALELGWTGTATGSRNGMQAGTIDAKAFLNDGTFRPYLLLGAGVYALQDAELTDGVTMAGPGARLGAGLELGDEPLTVNVGAIWQGMALVDLDDGPGELDLSGVSVGAGLSLNF